MLKSAKPYRFIKNKYKWNIFITGNRKMYGILSSLFPKKLLKDRDGFLWEGIKLKNRNILFLDYDYPIKKIVKYA